MKPDPHDSREEAYVIFDVGKTQKKMILFNAAYGVLSEQSVELPTLCDEDGFECDDINAIREWITAEWAAVAADPSINIKGLNFTSYGATLVHLDEQGTPVTPLYNYLKPVGNEVLEAFYRKFGNRETFAVETSSPPLGMLNAGFQLYWLKYMHPQLFRNVKCSLFLPQYLSFLFSGEKYTDLTSLGCHTGLWSFPQADLHPWVYDEWLHNLIAPVNRGHVASGPEKNNYRVSVGVGLHDSSSALLPYLYLSEEPFILLSTGTWGITLNPFNHAPLTREELMNDVLIYMLPNGDPVKASRFLLGMEHDKQCRRIGEYFGKPLNFHEGVGWDEHQFNATQGQVKLEEWDPAIYADDTASYYQLMRVLVEKLMESFARVDSPGIRTIFVDGGFARNMVFLQMLKKKLPGRKIITSKVPQATALGALVRLRQPRQFDLPGVELVSI